MKGDGDQQDIIAHLEGLLKKLKARQVKGSINHDTPTENGGIRTEIDRHSFS